MEPPQQPRIKTPEELARELEERLQQEAIRVRRWRHRREAYRILVILTGMLLPSLSLSLAGMIGNDGFLRWVGHVGWGPLLITAGGGAMASAVAFVGGWGVARGMMVFGALFMLLVALNQARLGTLVIAMPGLVALFVSTGGLVGYLITMEEEG